MIERRSLLKAIATLPILSACGDSGESELGLPPPPPPAEVKLLVQSWGTSTLIGKIAELLLREQLGLSASSVSRPEADIWTPLATGEAHACLEVWPLRNGEGARANVASGKVSLLGTLGAGRTAWFVPRYLVDKFPQLTTPTVAGQLGPLFQSAGITELLVGPADWITPSPARLDGLGVPTLPVRQEATEKSFFTTVRAAYAEGRPFLASLWYPHPLHSLYDLRAVGLPAAAGCDVNAATFPCDYPAETLQKVCWAGLNFSSPALVAFLNAFAPPLDDMVALLAASDDSREVLARTWIRTRQVVWTPWVNAARGTKT